MKKFISIMLVAIWLGVIYFASDMSNQESNAASTKAIASSIQKGSDIAYRVGIQEKKTNHSQTNELAIKLNPILRKFAHASVYFVLSILLCYCFYSFGKYNKISNIYILLFCLIYAILDEYHQTFITGRTGNIIDSLIDTSGAIAGIISFMLVFNLISKIKKEQPLIQK